MGPVSEGYKFGSKRYPEKKPVPIKPEIAHSALSVTLGQRLAKRAPMKRVKQ